MKTNGYLIVSDFIFNDSIMGDCISSTIYNTIKLNFN